MQNKGKKKPKERIRENKTKLYRRRLQWAREKLIEAQGEYKYHYVRYNNLAICHKKWKRLKDRKDEAQREVDRWQEEILRLSDLLDYYIN